MRLQHYKCIYCETSLQRGKIAHDLEHFRPKSSVKPWTAFEDGQRSDGVVESALESGYFWLAYDAGNYAAACKECNSTYKSTYFPIDAQRGRVGAPISELSDEKPLLCLPIGDSDTDPERLIDFDAVIAIPNPASPPFEQRRGRAIIALFLLNVREDLQRGRREMVVLLAPYLEKRSIGTADGDDLNVISACLSGRHGHTACCRAFERLWGSDPGRAIEIWRACKTLSSPEEDGV